MQYNHIPQYNAPRGDRGGFIGGEWGRGGFGQGRGPIVFHNFQKLGHYARDCPLPPMICMYCRTIDQDKEDCLTLLGKIQKIGTITIKTYNGFL
jgi:hypothetical protein